MLAPAADCEHPLADDQHPEIETVVRDELLNVQYAAQLRQHAKRSTGERFVLQAGDAAPF